MRTMRLDPSDVETALASADALADLDEQARIALASAALGFAFEDGDVIISEGAEGTGFYVMRSGRARVERDGVAVATIVAGDIFGEVALLQEGIRTASVIAEGPVEIVGLSRSVFRSMLTDNPRVAMKILQIEHARRGQA